MATGRMNDVVDHLRRAALGGDSGGQTDGRLLERFLAGKDEAAFAALVRRHGPMVLGVCRRVLGNEADAEDAFQATFLVLVKKAGSVRPREQVGNWLYGVAYRTALKAKGLAARRRAKEREMPRPQATAADPWPDLQPLLDQELSRLPDKYRVPVVLCDLEGKTHQEAARQLGWPVGTLSGRLSRARALLARRLTARGVGLSAGALAAVLGQQAASAAVPAPLAAATIRAGAALAAGGAVLSAVTSARVAALAEGVMKAMLLSKLKAATAVLLAAGVIGAGVLAYRPAAADEPPPAEATPARPTTAGPKAPEPLPLARLAAESDRIVVIRPAVPVNPRLVTEATVKGSLTSARLFSASLTQGVEKLAADRPGERWIVFLRSVAEGRRVEEWEPVAPAGWFLPYSDRLLREVKEAIPLPEKWGATKEGLRLGLRLRTARPAVGEDFVVEVCLQNTGKEARSIRQFRYNIYDYWPALRFTVEAPDGRLFVLGKPEGPIKESDMPLDRRLKPGETYIQAVRLNRWAGGMKVFDRPERYTISCSCWPHGERPANWQALVGILTLVSSRVEIQLADRDRPAGGGARPAGLSAHIEVKTLTRGAATEIKAALVLTNTTRRPVRLCTLVGGDRSSSDAWHEENMRPDSWKSDSPSPEQSARHVVTLPPGKSISLPFAARFPDRGQKAFTIRAAYEVGEDFARRLDTWVGRVEAPPVRVTVRGQGWEAGPK
jgi:RNA polymerase sigma-70 factor (ECF subfamily)